MLHSHPALAVVHESYFVPGLLRRREHFEAGARFDTEGFTGALLGHYGFARLDVPETAVRAALGQPEDTVDALRRIYGAFATHHGKQRAGDKTPLYVMNIDLLAASFPEARFVHVLRDGRDVALAYLANEWGPTSVEEAAVYWRRHVGAGRRSGGALGPARYREVRYERLVSAPEEVLRDLCVFLDLDYAPEMLRYHERADTLIPRAAHPEHHESLAQPPTPGLRRWQDQMATPDVEVFEALAGPTLTATGYERAHPRPSLPARLRARRREAALELRRNAGRAWRRLRRR